MISYRLARACGNTGDSRVNAATCDASRRPRPRGREALSPLLLYPTNREAERRDPPPVPRVPRPPQRFWGAGCELASLDGWPLPGPGWPGPAQRIPPRHAVYFAAGRIRPRHAPGATAAAWATCLRRRGLLLVLSLSSRPNRLGLAGYCRVRQNRGRRLYQGRGDTLAGSQRMVSRGEVHRADRDVVRAAGRGVRAARCRSRGGRRAGAYPLPRSSKRSGRGVGGVACTSPARQPESTEHLTRRRHGDGLSRRQEGGGASARGRSPAGCRHQCRGRRLAASVFLSGLIALHAHTGVAFPCAIGH